MHDPVTRKALSDELFLVRGISILLVVLVHVIGVEPLHGVRKLFSPERAELRFTAGVIHSFNMAVMLITSGAAVSLFGEPDTSFGEFAHGKLRKLVIPMLVWAPVSLVLQELSRARPLTPEGWLALLGHGAYTVALSVNTHLNAARRRLGLTYWSLSAWAKLKVKNAVNYIGRFEEFLVGEAKRHEVDGVICGHIHHPAMHDLLGILYVNTGDGVESCTATVEHYDGRLEMVRWADAGHTAGDADAVEARPAKSLEAA